MYPPVRSCGEKDLQDNGRRDLDKEICSHLDDYYPDWKDPKGTHMVPRSFISKAKNSDLGEITEKDFFDILKNLVKLRTNPCLLFIPINLVSTFPCGSLVRHQVLRCQIG